MNTRIHSSLSTWRNRQSEAGRNIQMKISVEKRNTLGKIAVSVGLFLIAFVIVMQSPDCIFSKNGIPETDSGVFQYIGKMMKAGKVPYRDMFDHKGILLYAINFVAALIPGKAGLWLIETLFMFLAVFGCYKIARLFCNRGYALFAVLIVFAMMYSYYDGGNFTEEFALPFQMLAVYIFLDYFLNQKVTNIRVLVCGAAFACVLLLRANLIAVWLVFCIMVLIHCIAQKEYQTLGKFLVWFLLGAGIVLLPVLIYLLCQHALGDFVYDYILFNKMYATNADYATMSDKLHIIVNFSCKLPVILAALVIFSLIVCRENSWFQIGYLVYMAVSLVLAGMSGKQYNHYGMLVLPMLAYPYAILFRKFQGVNVKKSCPHLVLCGYLLIGIVFAQWRITAVNVNQNLTAEKWDKELDQVVEYIKTNTEAEDEISVYGNRSVIYLLSDRRSASKYFYQTPIAQIDNKIKEQYYEDLKEKKPKLIVLATQTGVEDIMDFLSVNGYKQVKEYGSYHIYGY